MLERWTGFFEHINHYHRLYGARNGSTRFARRMQATLADMTAQHLPQPPGDLVLTPLGGIFLQAITWWLDTSRRVPVREIATRTAALASALITEANNGGSRNRYAAVEHRQSPSSSPSPRTRDS
ncbi:hypothetical protein GCM10023317_93240 [Actinopolymorpha pittospori]